MTTKELKVQIALGSLSTYDKMKVAESRRTSKKILTMLSTDENWSVRWRVARNLNTPIDILKELSKDEDSVVRWWATKANEV